MTKELLKIQPKTLVLLEGGYNCDYLGQHAEGVVRGLLGEEEIEALPADHDAGFSDFEKADFSKVN